jgi:hypothetical protein
MSKHISSFNLTSTTEDTIFNSSVGIGITAPAQQLHVYNAAATGSYNFTGGEGMVIEDGDANLQLKSNNVGSYGSGLLLTTAASTWGFASTTTALSNKLYIGHRTSASDEGIQGLMSKLVTIETSGNVGIGTDAPSSRLHVHNSGGAGQIQVTSSTSGTATSDGLIIEMSGSDDVLFLNKENTNMIFYTNNTEQVRIDSSGNVGIGTNSPTELLTLDRGVAGFPFIHFNENGTNRAAIGYHDTLDGLWLQANNQIAFYTGGANERMRIDSSGNVGIGTNAPVNKVTIRQDQADFTTLEIRNNNTTSNTAGSEILFGSYRDIQTTTFEGSKIRAINVNSGSSLFQYQDLAFYTNNDFNSGASERMRITKDGNVGIGTNNPTQKLDVNGVITSPQTFQSGIDTQNSATGTTTFPTAFNSTPKVVATIHNSNSANVYVVEIHTITTTGFDFIKSYQNRTGGSWNNAVSEVFTWIAMV